MIVSSLKQPAPGDLADWSDVSELQARMIEAMRAMSNLGNEVGVARTIREYNGDRRKQALARGMRAALAGGESAAKAEMEARASEEYAKELLALFHQLTAAEQTITLYDNHKLAWSTAQSLLAMQREGIKRL